MQGWTDGSGGIKVEGGGVWGREGRKEGREERRKEEMATAERYFLLSQRRRLWGWSDGGRDMRRWEGVEVSERKKPGGW